VQEGGGVLGEEPGGDFDLMIQFGAGEQLEAGTEGAAFGVVGGIDESGNPRLYDGTSAHGAGFQSNVEKGVGEAVVAKKMRGFTEDDNFGVGGGVSITNGAIAGARENRLIVDEHGANGDFASGGRGAGFVESQLHEVKIVRHGGNERKSLTQSAWRLDTIQPRGRMTRELGISLRLTSEDRFAYPR